MNQDKMHLVNKIFNNETIRTVWVRDKRNYISVFDIVGVISESKDGSKYWNKLKLRLKDEENKTVTNCPQLKLIEGMFRITESIPSKNAEPIKVWLAKLGSERIDETFDSSLTVQIAIDTYRLNGYSEEWIIKRIKGIQDRKKLTDVRNERGLSTEKEYAILTNEFIKNDLV